MANKETQEALKVLDNCPHDVKYCTGKSCKNCKIANSVKTLQELVDKATPKKISARIFEYQSDDDFEILCPNCNEVIMTREEYENYAKPNYCCNCGQALDWREENGK